MTDTVTTVDDLASLYTKINSAPEESVGTDEVKNAEENVGSVENEKTESEAVEEKTIEESSEDSVSDTKSADDLIEFQVGEETKKVPLSELVEAYTEKQTKDPAQLPEEVLQLKEQLIQRLDIMEKILSDNSDVAASLKQIDDAMNQAAADEDWTEVAKLQYQRQSIVAQAEQRGEILRKIRQEKEQESGEYNEQFYREQYQFLEKRAPDLLKDNGLQKVADFVSKTYNVPIDIVAEIKDARFFVMAKDAMAYADMQKKASEVIKPLKEAPKVVRRSVGKVTVSQSDVKQMRIKSLSEAIRKNPTSNAIDNVANMWLATKS